MPNWCSNKVVFTGTKRQVRRLRERVKSTAGDSAFSLESILPTPPPGSADLQAAKNDPAAVVHLFAQVFLGRKDAEITWYEWRLAMWGCKWDVDVNAGDYVEDGPTATWTIAFDSAWTPPIAALRVLAKKFRGGICIEYYETGCFFAGFTVWQDGKVVDESEGDPRGYGFVPEDEFGTPEDELSVEENDD